MFDAVEQQEGASQPHTQAPHHDSETFHQFFLKEGGEWYNTTWRSRLSYFVLHCIELLCGMHAGVYTGDAHPADGSIICIWMTAFGNPDNHVRHF